MLSQTSAGQFYPSFYSAPSFQPVFDPFLYNQPQFYSPPFPQPSFNLPPVLRFQPTIQQPYGPNIIAQQEVDQKFIKQASPPTTEKTDIQQTLPTVQLPLHGFRQSGPSAFPNDFLGYSYRTQFADGATSTVVLFQGGHPHDIALTRNRITVASDSLDPQKTKDAEQSIQKILSGM